jgi:hypothetical protein
MKKTIYKHAPLFMTLVILAFASCQKKDTANFGSPQTALSPKTAGDLQSSQGNWNHYAGGTAVFVSYKVTGTVGNESAKQALIADMSNDNSYVAYGNVLDAGSLQLVTVKDLCLQNSTLRDSLVKYAAGSIAVGDQIVTIQWQKGQATFTTQCIVGETGIVWDNILTGVIMLNTVPVLSQANANAFANVAGAGGKIGDATIQPDYIAAWYSYTDTWTADWIWGGHRGDMGYTITIYCYSNAQVYSTDHSDWANMDLGSARSDSRTLVNSGSYGKIQYALGIATPFASVSFNSSEWKVTVSGIGSSMVANGSKTLAPYNVN